ncbi:LysR family transcriptional regulator [Mesobaculum littorinae]|uniref:LysR family transcriptional regulator n=1 Tax=Mesobaculum littorinae TaxID=2486419 RepID=A0A438AFK6_9RHOB|nr:LysR substrate-binding domain-containing protein [Mesobaculum littorinae]RVV97484.1 LysR family transcriptional regulator [Mesobaculum littorinae]
MKGADRIPLNALRAAATVARDGSLSQAARALGVSVGAVSQQIARAEAQLGLPLFLRDRHGMTPTPEAAELLAGLGRGFSEIGRALDTLERRRDNVVRVSVAPIFATRWLVWRLRDFYRQNPGVKVRLDIDTHLADPLRGEVDYAIRVGPGGWPGVRAERLFDLLVVPVCAPEVGARLATPEDLATVPIIRDPDALFTWDDWLAPVGLSSDMLEEGIELPDASMCLDAAISGMGVFLAFEVLAREGRDYGKLVTPFPRYARTRHHYALVSDPARSPAPPQQAFRRWLMATLAEERMGDPAVVP